MDDHRIYRDCTIKEAYIPWDNDGVFAETYRQINKTSRTLVDAHRCYGLWELAKQVSWLDRPIIEVGSWRGGSGCVIAKAALLAGLNQPIFLCDTFAGCVKTGPEDPHYSGGEHADATATDVMSLAEAMGISNIRILEGIFPEETGHIVQRFRFGMAHIDVDTYMSSKDAFMWLWPKIDIGGVVVFDDYGLRTCAGVTQLVDELETLDRSILVRHIVHQAVVVKTR